MSTKEYLRKISSHAQREGGREGGKGGEGGNTRREKEEWRGEMEVKGEEEKRGGMRRKREERGRGKGEEEGEEERRKGGEGEGGRRERVDKKRGNRSHQIFDVSDHHSQRLVLTVIGQVNFDLSCHHLPILNTCQIM